MAQDQLPATEVHRILTDASVLLMDLYGRLAELRDDTTFTIGEAMGIVAKAKALVGRDIDDARRPAAF